jgi:hypothetical protein
VAGLKGGTNTATSMIATAAEVVGAGSVVAVAAGILMALPTATRTQGSVMDMMVVISIMKIPVSST